MRTLGRILTSLFILFAVFLTARAEDQGIISGQVSWKGGYGYVRDATIRLYDLSNSAIDSTRANFKGIFEMAVPAGRYYLSAEKDNLVRKYYPDAYLPREATIIQVSHGDYIQADFGLESGGWISGTFYYEGSDVPSGLITAIKIDQPHEGWYKSLTMNGPFPSAYAIRGLLPGTYKILGRARGKSTEYYPGVYEIGEADPITVIEDAGVSDIGFMLDEVGWGTIQGRIFNLANDEGISGQTIYAYQWHDFWQDPNLTTIRSSADGTYYMNIPAGDYFLFTIYMGDSGYRQALYYDDCYDPTSADAIHIADGQHVAGIDLGIDYSVTHDLTIAGTVSGRATGNGLNDVVITAIDYETGLPVGSACSNDQGNFLIGDMAPGRYLLMFSGTYIIPYFYPESYTWQDGGVIELENHLGDVRTEAITQDYGNNGLAITGAVRSSEGPLAGARVYAYPVGESEPIAYARTDVQGSYGIVSGLVPGSYMVGCDLLKYNGETFPDPVYLDLMTNPIAGDVDFVLDEVFTPVTEDEQLPNRITVSGNYPNPFNSKTLIRIYSGGSQELSTRISVFNILGQIVGDKPVLIRPGNNLVEWDAGNFKSEVSSGTYFYRFRDFGDTYRMILLK
jgi:hypothetical protein